MASTKRQAFTLVELLVVIAIIGMLMALLLPAVTQAIASARRSQCENNQRLIGQALQIHESGKGRFPGFINTLSSRPAMDQTVSWIVAILPELQRRDLYDIWSTTARASIPAYPIEMLVCPADPQNTLGGEWLSYTVNCGKTGEVYPPVAPESLQTYRAGGIFHDRTVASPIDCSLAYVAGGDGTATTLMLSEFMGADVWRSIAEHQVGFMWADADVAPAPNVPARVINRVVPVTFSIPNTAATTAAEARLSSGHAGGVIATFVDGHTIFVSETVDRDIYKLMCTPFGSSAYPAQSAILRESDFQR